MRAKKQAVEKPRAKNVVSRLSTIEMRFGVKMHSIDEIQAIITSFFKRPLVNILL